ncbi:hypothetical protein [Nocardioides bruguierae]|uniref:Right handed beta helix domain-containing protein n=1 Tax=Nocardioides bruguierae TaxID=2945102 RepID=A0A9X2DB23_9ACTN|nr:hypothetical protein [Nocardioides bruguierae]MCM0622648.1 hypothetical protein [Nocardioides bruguierae]
MLSDSPRPCPDQGPRSATPSGAPGLPRTTPALLTPTPSSTPSSTRTPRAHRTVPRWPARAVALVALVASALLTCPPGGSAATVADARGVTRYVSPTGDDSADGASPSTAWRTLERASAALAAGDLGAGSSLRLQRDGTWTGTLAVPASGTARQPLVVSAYGRGARPVVRGGGCVQVSGDHVLVTALSARACDFAGFTLTGDDVTVRGVHATGNVAGVSIGEDAERARVLRSSLVRNRRMAPDTPGSDDDYGAYGVEVLGDHATIAWNRITGQVADSADYGRDGSAVEVYGAVGTRVHHNVSRQNLTFIELGKAGTDDTVLAYNLVTSGLEDAGFVITRGLGDGFGPVTGTVVVHNTARLSAAGTQAFWCGGICTADVLTLSDNVLVAHARIGYALDLDGLASLLGGGRNLMWGSGVEHLLSPGDEVARPRFASMRTLRLERSSAAVDAGRRLRISGVQGGVDVTGRKVGADGDGDGVGRPDRGAVERRATRG